MKLYAVTVRGLQAKHSITGSLTQYAPSQTAASKLRMAFISDYGVKRDDMTTTEVDVPTSKGGLIEFLNEKAKLG